MRKLYGVSSILNNCLSSILNTKIRKVALAHAQKSRKHKLILAKIDDLDFSLESRQFIKFFSFN